MSAARHHVSTVELARTRLLEQLFDHVAEVGGALDLWERTSPGVLEALVAWSASRKGRIEQVLLDGGTRTTKCVIDGIGIHQITVFHRDLEPS